MFLVGGVRATIEPQLKVSNKDLNKGGLLDASAAIVLEAAFAKSDFIVHVELNEADTLFETDGFLISPRVLISFCRPVDCSGSCLFISAMLFKLSAVPAIMAAIKYGLVTLIGCLKRFISYSKNHFKCPYILIA